jgi:hypothetical protein
MVMPPRSSYDRLADAGEKAAGAELFSRFAVRSYQVPSAVPLTTVCSD